MTRRFLDYLVFPAVVVALLALTIVLWSAQRQQAFSRLEETTRLTASALRTNIESSYEDIRNALDRLAVRQPPDAPRRVSQWKSDADFYVSAFVGLIRTYWIDPSYTIQHVVPADGSELQAGGSAHLLEPDPTDLLLVQTAQYDGRFAGFVFGVVDLHLLLSSVAGDVGDRYSILITRTGEVLLEHGDAASHAVAASTSSLELDEAGTFTLTVSPTTSTTRDGFSSARTTLLIGLLVSAATIFVVLIAQLGRRLLLQERLHRQWEVFETTLDGIPQAVYVVDPSTYEVLFANKQILQLAESDPTGKKCFQALQGLDAPCPFCQSSVLPETGEPHTWEHRHRRSERDFLITDRLIDWPSGRRVRLSIATDITQMKEAERNRLALEAQLRQSQKLESIGTLASGIAHEVNNPLMGIINYAELLKEKAGDEEGRSFVEGIIREGNRVATIVRNLLSFARQDKEAHSPALISDIVEQSLSLTSAVLRKDGIKLDVDVPDDLPAIRCRSQQIEQVVINLVANGRDALNQRFPGYDEGKKLTISARLEEKDSIEWVHLVVEDRGIGIPKDEVGRVFDPFFTRKRREKGTGLGLSVSYGIVKEHKGELWVESTPGQYTRFHVELRVHNGWSLGNPTDGESGASEHEESDGESPDRGR